MALYHAQMQCHVKHGLVAVFSWLSPCNRVLKYKKGISFCFSKLILTLFLRKVLFFLISLFALIGYIINNMDPDQTAPLGALWPGLEVIKLFPCSTHLSTKFILLINVKMPTIVGILTFISMINTTSERLKARNFLICRYFSFYEQLKYYAQLSWA